MCRTSEEMLGGVGFPAVTFRAGNWCGGAEGVRRSIYPVKEAIKGGAVPRTELGEGGTVAAREKFLLIRHRWRRGVKDLVGRAGGDRSGDRLRVQGLEGGFVFILGDDAAHGVWGDSRVELFLKGLLLVAGARRGDD